MSRSFERFGPRERRGAGVRTAIICALAAASAALAACSSPSDADGHARDVAVIHLVTPDHTVVINPSGAQGGLTIPVGGTPIAAVFLSVRGDTVRLSESQFQIRLDTRAEQVVVFDRATPWSGTLRGIAPGTGLVDVSIFHIPANHADFGPHGLSVMVQ
jgi:hypothetical protein